MFTKDSVILDIISDHEETQAIFSTYDEQIGKCVMCNHMFDSLGTFAELYDINLNDLVGKLKTAIEK